MKKNFSPIFSKLLFVTVSILLLTQTNDALAQCPCTATNFASIDVSAFTVGQSQTITTCQFGGERATINNTVAGATYRISTCGSSYDTQLSIYTTGCSFLAYNDDSGPACTGLQASVDFTSPGGNIFSVMNLYSCTTNSTCATVSITLISVPPPSNECPNGSNLGVQPFTCGSESIISPVNQGDYTQFSVINGVGYNFNTNGSSYDTKIYGKINGTGGATLFYQDIDNIGGVNESVDYVANFAGTIGVASHLTNCGVWNSTSAVLRYRQLTTVTNTTSSAAICGGTKPLTYSLGGLNNSPNPTWQIASGGGTISSNDYLAGAYTGPVTVNAILGVCTSAVSFTVNPSPTADAGAGLAAICQGGTTVSLGGSVGGGATGGIWSDGGAGGSFSPNANNLNALYTASATAGSPITLTLTTSGGLCGTTTDTKFLVVNPNPTANAGGALAAICQGGTTAALGGTVGGGATGGTWSDGGAGGTFPGGSSNLNTTYTASATSASPVTLTLTTSGGSCGTTTATKQVVVNTGPTASAGAALAAICQGGTSSALGGTVGGGATGGIWDDGGAGGTFNPNATTLNATYTSSATASSPITLTLTTSGGLCGTTAASKSLTVRQTPNGSISISSPICVGASANLTFNFSAGTGPFDVVYSDGTSNFNANGISSGTIVSVSPGVGTTTYSLVSISDANTCSRNSGFSGPTVSLLVNPLDNAGFSYSASSYCSNITNPSPTITGLTGGSFSGDPGLFVNSSSGVISLASSSAGVPHVVTYTTNGICPTTATFNVSITASDNTSFSYSQPTYCVNGGGTVTPVITGLGGGTFSSTPAGLTFNTVNGGITLATSTPNPYTVNYVTNGTCPDTGSAAVTIVIADNPAFSYAANSFCVNGSNPLPTITGLNGGTFTAPAGLTINATTGQITVATSTLSVPFIVTYTTNGPCPSSATFPVIINPFPVVSFTGLNTTYCINETNANTLNGSPSGGTFSGLGIVGNTFTASLTTIGSHVITYTFTDGNGCTNSTTQSELTNGLPFVSFSGLATAYCVSSATPIPLTGSPVGGTFSGTGITGSSFSPATAGVGIHAITYTYTDPNGCINTSTQQVSVYALPTVAFTGLNAAYCITDAATLLTGFPTGGTFTGTGLTGGNTFDPTVATIGGPYTITYTFTDGNSCTNSISQTAAVNNTPTVSITGLNAAYCSNDAAVPVTLTPSGGTLSGPGISGLNFNPAAAGTGNLTLSYTFTNGSGCSNSTTFAVTVNAAPTVTFSGLNAAYCENSPSNTLTGFPTGGTFTGTGITGTTFNPQVGGTGNRTITYTFIDGNSCTNSTTNATVVNTLPVVSFTGLAAQYCISQSTQVNLTGTPSGGSFIVNGVVGATFIPNQHALGTQTISYFVSNVSGCADTTTQTTTIVPAPIVTLTGLAAFYCTNSPVVTLVGTPVGGFFTGAGMLGNTFNPAIAGSGITFAAYTYDDGNGCRNSISASTTINFAPTVTFSGLNPAYCQNSPLANLTGFPSGGAFSGNGIIGSNFNPQTAGLGSQTITYTFTDVNNCTNSATNSTVINALPTVTYTGLASQYCISQNTAVNLVGNPPGGTFIVNGVVGASFIPSQHALGVQTIDYFVSNINGCADTTTQTTTIVPAPTVTIAGLAAQYCSSATVVNLTGNPATGTFSGPGIVGNTFNPGTAGTGSKTITYSYNDGNGCSNSTTASTIVNAQPVISFSGLDAAYCTNSPSDILVGSPVGGTFSGTGITGTTFNPQVGGAGSRTITYSFTDGNGCSNTTTNSTVVNALPVVSYTGLAAQYCISQTTAVSLTGTPAGGTFIVNGVVGASFIPSQQVLGVQTIKYFVNNVNGCADTTSQTTTVVPAPTVTLSGLAATYCSNAATATLNGSPAGGTFTGSGILGNTFSPPLAGTGNIFITYSYNDGNGCSNSTTSSTIVNAAPTVTFSGLNPTYCTNSPLDALTGFPGGGTFTGTGIVGTNFNPQLPGTGNYTITYTFTNGNGCTNFATNSTVINALPVVSFTGLAAQYCISQTTAVALTGSPAGGSFVVNGAIGASFIPSQHSLGVQTIDYFVSNANGCADTVTQTTNVVAAPVVTISGLAAQYCSNGTSVTLTGNPAGGTFSGFGITGSTFNPASSGTGTVVVSYAYSDGNGCSNTGTATTTVFAPPTISFTGLNTAYCENSPSTTLIGNPTGGTFSGTAVTGSSFNPQSVGPSSQTVTYTFTDGNSCTNTTTNSTTINAVPVVSFGGLIAQYCISQTTAVTLTGTPAGGTFIVNGIVNAPFIPSQQALGTQTISYFVSNASGCADTTSQTTTIVSAPSVGMSGLSNQYCNNSPVSVMSGNPAGGTFSGAGVTANTFDPSAAGTGNITITYTYSNGAGCSNSTTFTTTVFAAPIVSFNGLDVTYCVNGAIDQLFGNPVGGLFTGFGIPTGTSTFSPVQAGTGAQNVTYTYTDGNNCTNSSTLSTTVNPLPVVSFTGLATTYCESQTTAAPLTGSPTGGTYTGTGIVGSGFTPAVATVGTYTITYTYSDANGCSNSIQNITDVVALPVVTLTGLNSAYCEDATASVMTGLPGGGTFAGATGVAGGQFDPGTAGVGAYTVTYTYTDGNNCTNVASQAVDVNPLPAVPNVVPAGSIDICAGASALLDAGIGYSTYAWSNAGTAAGNGQQLVVITAGTYDVTVTNIFGCLATSAATTVNVVPLPVVFLGNDTTICTGTNITLDAGAGFDTYTWSTGPTGTQTITTSGQGVYSVTVTNLTGCSGSDDISILEASGITPIITASGNTEVCQGDSVLLNTDLYSGYFWSDGVSTTQSIYVHTAGPIVVNVTDANGCQGTSEPITISLIPLPQVNVTANGPTEFCAGGSVTLDAGLSFTNYLWSNTVSTHDNVVNQPGTYLVTVTGTNGCSNTSAPITVVVHFPPNPVITADGPTTFCKGGDVMLTCTPAGMIYLWTSFSSSQSIVVTQSGSYGVTVQDAFGCVDSSYILSPIEVVVISPTPLLDVNGNTFTVNPATFATYQWFQQGVGGNPDIAIPGATSATYIAGKSGTYYVVVTDATGCSGSSTLIEHTYIGIESVDFFTHFNIYPNPAEDILTIDLGLKTPGSLQISVVSASGQLVREMDLGVQNKETIKSFRVDQLANGLYTIIVKANNQVMRTNFVKK